MNTPELQELLHCVKEESKNLTITSKGFDNLADNIETKTGEQISSSTLKRLWGYVGDRHKIRMNTLDILSRYIGFTNFETFTKELKKGPQFNSYFFATKEIKATEISYGDPIEIGWAPNRIVEIECRGMESFIVTSSENSKLRIGDTFCIKDFMMGLPLYIPAILRDGQYTVPYIAGCNGGLTLLQKIEPPAVDSGPCKCNSRPVPEARQDLVHRNIKSAI
jgi:hypothetical protein